MYNRKWLGASAAAFALSVFGGVVPMGASASGASGGGNSPILLGGMTSITGTTTFPQERSGWQAAISSINAAGGVGGRKLKLVFCDTQYTANGEINCARQLTAAHVAAVVAPNIVVDQSGSAWKIFQTAGIPAVGSFGVTAQEYSATNVFPIGAGIPGWAYGAVDALVAGGNKKVTILGTAGVGVSTFFVTLGDSALKSAGLTPLTAVYADPTTDPTYSVAASKVVASGANGVLISVDPTDLPKALTALKQAGYKGKISTVSILLTPATLKTLGSTANGVLVSGQVALATDTSNPGVKAFVSSMKKYQPNASVDEDSEVAWAATELFAKVMAGAKTVSAATTLAAFTNLQKPVSLGLIGPYKVKGSTPPLAAFARIFNPTVAIGVAKSGKLQPKGGLVNPFTALTALGNN
jgi:ABC-type branched-subunit amino acid transport system substrate-binding protein